MKNGPKSIKIVAFALIIFLILISFSPVTIGNSKFEMVKQIREKLRNKFRTYSLINQKPLITSKEPDSSPWTQVIGDYPKGQLDNGFNNVNNVAVRGKTTFIVDNKEYLFLGTGNVVTAPLNPEMISSLISKFLPSS